MDARVLSLIERVESTGEAKVVEMDICGIRCDETPRTMSLDGEDTPAGAYLQGRISFMLRMKP